MRMLLGSMVLLFTASVTTQDIVSSFDTGDDGWRVAGFSYTKHIPVGTSTLLPGYDAVNGRPAGSIRVGDVFAETAVTGPSAYVGNKLAFYGGQVSFDIFVRFTDIATYPAVMLRGTTKTLFYNMPNPNVGVWQSRLVPLTEKGWTVNSWRGPAATQAEMFEVLGQLTGFLITTEWRSGPDDTNIDNVRMSPPRNGISMYGSGCLGSSGSAPWLSVTGAAQGGTGVVMHIVDGAAMSSGFVLLGLQSASVPFHSCTILIQPILPVAIGPISLDAAGRGQVALALPSAFSQGAVVTLQALVVDPGLGLGFALSNGVKLTGL